MMRFWFGVPLGGFNTGVSFGREDFARLSRTSGPSGQSIGFVYVIRGPNGRVKIGCTTDPENRIRQLSTGSPTPLDFAFLAMVDRPKMLQVEKGAHAILLRWRLAGEWFDCPEDVAIVAVTGAAHTAGAPVVPVRPDQVEQALAIAARLEGQQAATPRPIWPYLVGATGLAMLVTPNEWLGVPFGVGIAALIVAGLVRLANRLTA